VATLHALCTPWAPITADSAVAFYTTSWRTVNSGVISHISRPRAPLLKSAGARRKPTPQTHAAREQEPSLVSHSQQTMHEYLACLTTPRAQCFPSTLRHDALYSHVCPSSLAAFTVDAVPLMNVCVAVGDSGGEQRPVPTRWRWSSSSYKKLNWDLGSTPIPPLTSLTTRAYHTHAHAHPTSPRSIGFCAI